MGPGPWLGEAGPRAVCREQSGGLGGHRVPQASAVVSALSLPQKKSAVGHFAFIPRAQKEHLLSGSPCPLELRFWRETRPGGRQRPRVRGQEASASIWPSRSREELSRQNCPYKGPGAEVLRHTRGLRAEVWGQAGAEGWEAPLGGGVLAPGGSSRAGTWAAPLSHARGFPRNLLCGKKPVLESPGPQVNEERSAPGYGWARPVPCGAPKAGTSDPASCSSPSVGVGGWGLPSQEIPLRPQLSGCPQGLSRRGSGESRATATAPVHPLPKPSALRHAASPKSARPGVLGMEPRGPGRADVGNWSPGRSRPGG